MKKRLIALFACVVLALGLLAGCGSSSSSDTTAAAEDTSAAAEGDATEAAGDAADAETLKAAIDETIASYQTAFPNGESAATEVTIDGTTYQKADAEVVLSVTSHDPENCATGAFLDSWAADVIAASEGAIWPDITYGGALAGPKDSWQAVQDGTVDIAWGLQSFYDGTFPLTEVFMLPLIDLGTAPEGSEAIWETYKSSEAMQAEYSAVHTLVLHVNCQSPVSLSSKSSVQKIETVDDFAGLGIRGNAGPPQDFITALGASVESCSINDLYSKLETAEMDGCLTDWHGIYAFNLDEVIASYLDENIGVSTYFLVMNNDKYNSLTEDQQKILDECSENALQYTSVWDEVEEGQKAIVESEGKLYTLSDDAHAALQEVADGVIEAWKAESDANATIYEAASKYFK